MSRARHVVLLTMAVTLIAACGNDNGKKAQTATSTSGAARPSTTTAPPVDTPTTQLSPTVEFHAYNVRLFNSEESDNGFRVLLQSAASKLSVTLKGGLPSPNEVVHVCPAASIDTHGTASKCVTPRDGEAVEIEHGAGLEAIEVMQVGVGGSAPSISDGILINEIVIAYTASDHTAKVRLPPIDVPLGASICKDNGCNPFFEMTPFRAGTLAASATWQGGGNGALSLEVGKIAERAQSSEGQPYDIVASSVGGPGVSISGTAPEREAAITIRNTGEQPMIATMVTISWP